MYPYDVDPREYVRQALAMQTPTALTNAFLPQMTPASHGYYGPAHEALLNALQASLLGQMQPRQAGLLSAPTPYVPVQMPSNFYRITPSTWDAAQRTVDAYNAAQAAQAAAMKAAADKAAADAAAAQAASSSNGGGRNGDSTSPSAPDMTRTPITDIIDGIFGRPTSVDAPGVDRKVAGTPSIGMQPFADSTGGLGPQPSITGTPLAAPSNDLMPGIGAQPSITGTNIGTPMQEPSQTLNGLLTGNYEPVTGYANNFSRITSPDFTPAPNADVSQAVTAPTSNSKPFSIGQALLGFITPDIQPNNPINLFGPTQLTTADLNPNTIQGKLPDRIVSEEDQQANSAATRQQVEQAAAQEAANIAALQASDAQQMADRSDGGYSGMGHSPDSGYGANNGDVSTGGESASERSDGAWRMGGPVPKRGNGPPKPVRGTVHEGEYVIRPESVKVLPPGLLSALNDIYKSPNPKKTLRGLLG
jgi:hypothetical protein